MTPRAHGVCMRHVYILLGVVRTASSGSGVETALLTLTAVPSGVGIGAISLRVYCEQCVCDAHRLRVLWKFPEIFLEI